jgi:hypothetical protein
MARQCRTIFWRHDELLERSVDLEEIDVGDESINAGIDGGLWIPGSRAEARAPE